VVGMGTSSLGEKAWMGLKSGTTSTHETNPDNWSGAHFSYKNILK
jgi:hypothetical protein